MRHISGKVKDVFPQLVGKKFLAHDDAAYEPVEDYIKGVSLTIDEQDDYYKLIVELHMSNGEVAHKDVPIFEFGNNDFNAYIIGEDFNFDSNI